MLIEELGRAGILDLSVPLFERFDYEPDLFADGYSAPDNLRNVIRQSLYYIQTLLSENKTFKAAPANMKLIVIATRQGVHVEIPADIFCPVSSKIVLKRYPDYLENFYNRNVPKLLLVEKFFQTKSL